MRESGGRLRYQNAKPGTATFNGNARADVADDNPSASGTTGRWMAVAEVAMSSTVTPTGTVLKLKPL